MTPRNNNRAVMYPQCYPRMFDLTGWFRCYYSIRNKRNALHRILDSCRRARMSAIDAFHLLPSRNMYIKQGVKTNIYLEHCPELACSNLFQPTCAATLGSADVPQLSAIHGDTCLLHTPRSSDVWLVGREPSNHPPVTCTDSISVRDV